MTADHVLEVAQQLSPEAVETCEPISGGGNNRLYKIKSKQNYYALKWYPTLPNDTRDRLGTEFQALEFLQDHGPSPTPRAIAASPETGFALYSWTPGVIICKVGHSDIDESIGFVSHLRSLSRTPAANKLPEASEACLSPDNLIRQIEQRAARLLKVSDFGSPLHKFLTAQFQPLFTATMERARRAYNDKSLQTDMMLERKLAILSPSDFGFHNALRQKDNRLVFVDFEYFGWDDPVKMLSDFLLHPGMTLTSSLRGMFCARFCSLFEDDRQLGLRFRSLYPLYALRWTMILLNEFLPERLERRILSGSIRHVGAAQRKQLLKANSMIAHCRDALHHFPYAVTPDSIQ